MQDSQQTPVVQSYTIAAISLLSEYNDSFNGPMFCYSLQLNGVDMPNLQMGQKQSTRMPDVGSTLTGHIDTSGKYPKFRKAQLQGATTPKIFSPAQNAPISGANGNTGYKVTVNNASYDNKSASIQRMHSQEMAVRLLAVMSSEGKLSGHDDLTGLLKTTIDWFDNDVNNITP